MLSKYYQKKHLVKNTTCLQFLLWETYHSRKNTLLRSLLQVYPCLTFCTFLKRRNNLQDGKDLERYTSLQTFLDLADQRVRFCLDRDHLQSLQLNLDVTRPGIHKHLHEVEILLSIRSHLQTKMLPSCFPAIYQ